MKFQTAINKCVGGKLVSNDNMGKSYLEYDKEEKRLLWWDSIDNGHWSYPEDKDSQDFIKELNLEWYLCDDKGHPL